MLLLHPQNTYLRTNLGGIQEQINIMDNALREMENGMWYILKSIN